MPDWMDDLLADLPCEPASAGLLLQIKRRLASERRRQRWVGRAARLPFGLAAALGIWLFVPGVGKMAAMMPQISIGALAAWMQALLTSPLPTLQESLGEAMRFGAGVASAGVDGILALVLIAVPAMAVAGLLLRQMAPHEEAMA